MLSLYWYKAVVKRAHLLYFNHKVLYGANNIAPELDNVDQRIAADARQFTTLFGSIMFGMPCYSSLLLLRRRLCC